MEADERRLPLPRYVVHRGALLPPSSSAVAPHCPFSVCAVAALKVARGRRASTQTQAQARDDFDNVPNCTKRVGAPALGSSASTTPSLAETDLGENASIRIDDRRDAGIGGAHDRQTLLDGAHAAPDGNADRDRRSMPNHASLVRLRSQPGRRPAVGHVIGEDDLVADERACRRRAGNRRCSRGPVPALKPPRTPVSCMKPRLSRKS